MQKEYGLSVSAEDILEGVNQVVKDFYYKEAVMKPGAYALVKRLKENGVKLIIATATDKEMAKAALIRNGIWQDFTGMITCEEAGAGKTSPTETETTLPNPNFLFFSMSIPPCSPKPFPVYPTMAVPHQFLLLRHGGKQ